MAKARVLFEGEAKEVSFTGRKDVMEVLRLAGLNPDVYLVRRKGEIIPDDEVVRGGDRLECLRVVSGG